MTFQPSLQGDTHDSTSSSSSHFAPLLPSLHPPCLLSLSSLPYLSLFPFLSLPTSLPPSLPLSFSHSLSLHFSFSSSSSCRPSIITIPLSFPRHSTPLLSRYLPSFIFLFSFFTSPFHPLSFWGEKWRQKTNAYHQKRGRERKRERRGRGGRARGKIIM